MNTVYNFNKYIRYHQKYAMLANAFCHKGQMLAIGTNTSCNLDISPHLIMIP